MAGPIRSHSTPTSEGRWDGSRMEKRLGSTAAVLRRAHAWVDGGQDPDTKSAYKFIHHEVDGDGQVGAASVRACTSAIGVLNGARGGADIPDADRAGVHRHLARHLSDGGHEPAPLK